MKFFSNEAARDNTEEDRARAAADTRDVDTTVPQQRAGSPWSDRPGDEAADRDRDLDLDLDPDKDNRDKDHPHKDHRDGDEAADDTSGAHRATTTTYGPAGASADADSDPDRTTAFETGAPVKDALKDDGGFDSPKAVDPATGESLTDDSAKDPRNKDVDRTGALPIDDPDTTAIVPATTTPAPVPAAVPVAAAATSTTATPAKPGDTPVDRLFPADSGLADRFRDIQLRFVDSPKEATAEAATLVGEALDHLTKSLQERKTGLASDSEDTEKLRVELRGYRELMNRLLDL